MYYLDKQKTVFDKVSSLRMQKISERLVEFKEIIQERWDVSF